MLGYIPPEFPYDKDIVPQDFDPPYSIGIIIEAPRIKVMVSY